MAQRRGKSQARRHGGNGGGLPGWAWLVLGVALTLGAILVAPRFLGGGEGDGFFRPKANPDAQPVSARGGESGEDLSADAPRDAADSATAAAAGKQAGTDDYDFYDLLPGEEVAMTDAQLAAAAREEAARAQRAQQRQATQPDAAGTAMPSQPQPLPETVSTPPAAGTTPAGTPATTPTQVASAAPAPSAGGNDTPYVLQAGAFGASGDAEALKARIALLGLNARVESAQIAGKTVYRVRMGPYGTASELAQAKGKLSSGGLPAMAIKAR